MGKQRKTLVDLQAVLKTNFDSIILRS
jgi:hypothetical protein